MKLSQEFHVVLGAPGEVARLGPESFARPFLVGQQEGQSARRAFVGPSTTRSSMAWRRSAPRRNDIR